MKIGIIGGTGVYQLGGMATRSQRIHTPYDSVDAAVGTHAGRELIFLARHGAGHSIPPHKINYLANIDALRREGCGCILATNAVGSIRGGMQPGDLVLPDQFLDFTKCRPLTFYEGGHAGLRHVDVTEPYCPALRSVAFDFLEDYASTVHPAGTYVCTEGPRFETPAEIAMFAQLGGDVVGMTGVPEVVLAREAGICYVSICVVTNFAAGIADGPLTEGEVTALMNERLPVLHSFLLRLVEQISEQRECGCAG